MRRRRFLGTLIAAPLAWSLAGGLLAGKTDEVRGRRVVVVGAGAFGGWTALALQQAGARVTLLESWAAGHPRSSSGGETRVIRHLYDTAMYVRMAARALTLWQSAASRWQRPLFERTGVLFLAQSGRGAYLNAATEAMDAESIAYEKLNPDGLGRRFPQIDLDGIEFGLFEATAGYLLARRACHAVVQAFIEAGGEYRIASARASDMRNNRLHEIELCDGSRLGADSFVFACGPWMRELFPEALGNALRVTRQEVFYFGAPPGDRRHRQSTLPVWADFGERLWYGIPGSERRGFKIADDSRGESLDPTASDRIPSAAGIEAARAYLSRRFPALRHAPLVDARVCQYTNTGDGHFILDRHPQAGNLWLLGGGSGHGFKHAPAFGEMAAEAVVTGKPPEPAFTLARLSTD